jgi:hypothetical protein
MRILAFLFMAGVFHACDIKRQSKLPADMHNQLTEDEKNDGWLLLFDGKTLAGWRIFRNLPNTSWEAVDGTLHCRAFQDGAVNERTDLITTNEFADFELAFQWRISSQGNSGVMFRVSEEYDYTYASGPEYQVIDDAGYPGELPAENKSAAAFGLYATDTLAVYPAGQWNDGKIIVKGNHVQHWLNGVKVLDYTLFSEDWHTRKNASKWKDFPGYASANKGYIALQDHGNEVWYRDIKIKKL